MPKVMSLGDSNGLGEGQRCKCVRNPRTGKTVKLCFVGKSKRNRSGWQFVAGGCSPSKK